MRGVIMKGKTLYHCYLLKCQPKYVWPDYSCSHSTESWHGMRFSLSMPLQIFSMAGLTCALCCACVCRSWKEIVDHPLMWNRVCSEKGCSSVTTYVFGVYNGILYSNLTLQLDLSEVKNWYVQHRYCHANMHIESIELTCSCCKYVRMYVFTIIIHTCTYIRMYSMCCYVLQLCLYLMCIM